MSETQLSNLGGWRKSLSCPAFHRVSFCGHTVQGCFTLKTKELPFSKESGNEYFRCINCVPARQHAGGFWEVVAFQPQDKPHPHDPPGWRLHLSWCSSLVWLVRCRRCSEFPLRDTIKYKQIVGHSDHGWMKRNSKYTKLRQEERGQGTTSKRMT